MTSKFGYFARLIEMTNRGSIEAPGTGNYESNEVMRKSSEDSQILTQADGTGLKFDIFSHGSEDEIVEQDNRSKVSKGVRPDNVLEILNSSEKKQVISETISKSNPSITQANGKENEDMNISHLRKKKDASLPMSQDLVEQNLQTGLLKNESQVSTAATFHGLRQMNNESDLQTNTYLEGLLDNPTFNNSIKENIDRMIHSKFDQLPESEDHLNYSHGSLAHEHPKDDHVSVSIGTIVIKVSNANRVDDLKPIQNNSERNAVQSTDRLRRYYLRLR